jgi:hypothetical protein
MDPADFIRDLVSQLKVVIQEETARGVAAAVSKAHTQETPTQHAQIQSNYGNLRTAPNPAFVQVFRMTPEGERVVVVTTTAQLLAETCDILLDISDTLARERPRRRKRA